MIRDYVHMNVLTLEINLHFNFVDPAKPPHHQKFLEPLYFEQLNLSPAMFSSYHPMSQGYQSRAFKTSLVNLVSES